MIESSSNILHLYISQFVRNIAIDERDMLSTLLTSSHNNRCVIFYKFHNYRISIYHKARPDFSKCASGILKVFQLKIFVNRHTFCIKITPKFIMFKNNTTNSLQSSFILRLTRLNALRPVAFVTKKNASRPFSTKYLVEQFIVFPYLGFSSGPPSTVKIITFFSSCLSVWKLVANSDRECTHYHIFKMSECRWFWMLGTSDTYVCSTWIGDHIIC